MKEDERSKIYKDARTLWGDMSQVLMAVEEFSELNHALLKYMRGLAKTVEVWEELADAEIMLEQMKEIFGFNNKIKGDKLQRLRERIENQRNEGGV